MQFIILGHDGKDAEAKKRRQAARQAHIDLGEKLRLGGNMWYGAALLDDNGNMNGSMILVDFPDRKSLDQWLKDEPYVVAEVWKKIEIYPCNVRDPAQFNRPAEFFESR
ncbi:MAG TPA: YciI family protein [Candidatus Babeliales bacterium]|nr:YciI family protein [Candidatus Babeliales bacterium]